MTKEQLLSEAKLLPKQDQIDLVMDLWNLIELTADDLPLTDEQKAEFDRRLLLDAADPVVPVTFDALKTRLSHGDV